MEQQPASAGLEGQWGDKKLKITGNDIITILVLLLVAGIGVVLWMHHVDAREGRAEFISALKEQSAATREQTVAQREQNCLFRFTIEERQKMADFCKTNAR